MHPPHQPENVDLDDARLDDLLDRWEDACERGEEPSIDAMCVECPELAPRLAQRVAQLRQLDGFLAETVRPDDTHTSETHQAELPESFGDYQVLDLIAEGGMGAVYRARQQAPNRIVALKVLRSGEASTSREVQRFMLEAEAAARLAHPGVVPIFDVGEHAGRHYFTMEFVEGRSLSQIVRDDGPLEPRVAAEIIRSVGEAVHYAHEMGVVHRDLKPANVLIDTHGNARVTDFGIAKQLELDTALTATGQILGTPDFMSPEQARGVQTEIGKSTDIFSLGATLYALLTGRPPFRADDVYTTIRRVIDDAPVSLRKLNSRVDRDLETICLKCLAKAPAERYQTARELADDLNRYLNGETIRARRTPVPLRIQRWLKRHPAIALASIVLLAGSVFAAYRVRQYLHYEREFVSYFQNTERRRHVLVGVGEISADDARQRQTSWRITRRGKYGPVVRAERVNWLLQPEVFSGVRVVRSQRRMESIWEYEYDSDGNLSKEHALDHTRQRVWSFLLTAPDRGHYLDQHGLPHTSQGTDLVGRQFEFDDDGRLVRELYTDFRGNPRPDEDGVFGRHMERSESTTVTTFLGPDGKPMLHKSGFVSYRETRDAAGNVIERDYLDRAGRLTLSRDGFARLRAEFDEFGRLQRERYFGVDDQPAVVGDGFHESRTGFTTSPPAMHQSYFDLDSQPVIHREGYHKQVGSFDEQGAIASIRYYDVAGNPATQKDGSTGAIWESDEHGLPSKMTYVDAEGRPVVSTNGYASWTVKNDDHGNRIEQSYFDENGKPASLKEGFATSRWKFDKRDQMIEVAYFDTANRPTMTSHGFARQVITRDEKGNVIKEEYFDAAGKPAYQKQGYTHVRQQYDEYGRRTRLMWYGHDDRPVRTAPGFAGQTFRYDKQGNVIETRWLDTAGKLTRNDKGFAIDRRKYDRFGRVVEVARYGIDGRLVRGADGVARNTLEYDDIRHRIDERLFDEKGNPVITRTSGAFHVRDTRDARGNLLRREFFGTRDEPIRGLEGYHRFENRVDARGNVIENRRFDERGQPLRAGLGEFGQAMKYDARGNITEYTFLGPDGKPAKTPSGFIRWTQRFDRLGNRLEFCVRDEAGRPFAYSPTGIAGSRFRYDRFGNQIERTTIGTDFKPCADRTGTATLRREFDVHGRKSAEYFFGPKGEPTTDRMQVHGKRYEYDARGNVVKTTILGRNGKPTNLYGHYAVVALKFDDYGRSIDQRFFDAAGNRAVHYYHRFHHSTRQHDRFGREVESRRYGIDDKLSNGIAGWALVRTEYDDSGWVVRRRYYRADGQEVFPRVIVHAQANPRDASRLGLKPRDVLVAYDGQPITDPRSFRDRRKQHRDNRPRTLIVERGRPPRTLTLQVLPSLPLPRLNQQTTPKPSTTPPRIRRVPIRARRPKSS